MATVNGDTITIFQGETLDLSFPVVDSDGNPLSLADGQAILSYRKSGGAVVDLECTISTSTVTRGFSHEETAALNGRYLYQLMCRNSGGKIVMTVDGVLNVKESLNPDIADTIGDVEGADYPGILTTEGDILYRTSAPARLPIGTSGYVIKSSGTAPAWAAPGGLGITDTGTYYATDTIDAAFQQLGKAADVTAWAAWVPSLTWTGTPPASLTTVARWMKINKTVFFNFYTTSADGNGATALTISLPVAPKANGFIIPVTALELQNTTHTDPKAYIDDSGSVIAFYGFTTATDSQAIKIKASGQYEIA